MENLNDLHNQLQDLRRQAKRLISISLSLAALFAEEANRLRREGEASRLSTLYSTINQQLDTEKLTENAASCGNSQASLILTLGGLAVKAMASNNKRVSAFADHLLQDVNNERHFGTVRICIGPKGLPDDVRVVSISRLARELKRQESAVINELQEQGCLLYDENAFSLLIDRLVNDVREGKLRLPVSREKLSPIRASNKLKIIPVETELP